MGEEVHLQWLLNRFHKMILYRIFFFLIISQNFAFAQADNNFLQLKSCEDSLAKIAYHIVNAENSTLRQSAIYHFDKLLKETLEKDDAFSYPFDSLKYISVLKPRDKSFKIFTWHLLKDDKTYKYFGYIHIKTQNGIKLFKLIDQSENILQPEDTILNCQNWYGAHYYEIIEKKYKGKNHYTLLGWDGNNNFTSKKIIDVLTFNNDFEPEFGAPVFELKNKKKFRYIFEYDAKAVFLLRYNVKKKMIVHDHLSPQKPELEGMFMFYGPDMTYDGLKFKKGKWNLVENIDLRNK